MHPCANPPIRRNHPAYSFSVDNQTLTDTVKSQQARLHDIYSTVAGEKDTLVCEDLSIFNTEIHSVSSYRMYWTWRVPHYILNNYLFRNTDAELFVENPLHLRRDPENEAQGKTSQGKTSQFIVLTLITVTVLRGLTGHSIMTPTWPYPPRGQENPP